MGQKLITPNKITKLKKNEIFVFGSNLAGIHGAGAALLAQKEFNAESGIGEGLTGQCYALPTKDFNIVSRGIDDIAVSVKTLILAIKVNPKKVFLITEVGCGLAGFKQSEIAPLFTELHNSNLENYSLPQTFLDILTPKTLKRGYKVTDANMKCRDYQYELNKIYTHAGSVRPCSSGFHYCEQAVDCFEYYSFTSSNRVFEIIDHGKSVKDGDKTCTSSIEFVRELSWQEVLVLVNTGKDNTGRRNSGDRNSGNWNSGDSNSGNWNSGNWNSGNSNSGNRNSGNWNSGDSNSGYRNSGYRNSGNWNSGNRNSGNWNSGNRNSGDSNSGNRNSGNRNSGDSNSGNRNSGNWNSGDRNSGDSNSGYRNSGAFCTEVNPKLVLFDKECDITVREWEESRPCQIMYNLNHNIWVWPNEMTDKEKKEFPTHETTGGYLKTISHKEAWTNLWGNLNDSDKKLFLDLPNFDEKKFKEITGITI